MSVSTFTYSKKVQVVWQEPDKDSCDVAEEPLVLALDAGDTLFIQQHDEIITLNQSTIPVLIKTLKEYQ